MPDWREKERRRDAKLRRRLLVSLEQCLDAPKGGIRGDALVESITDVGEGLGGFEGEDHAIRLLRHLAGKGFVRITDVRKRDGQMFGLKNLFLEILPLGSSLLNETCGPDKDVDDERNLEE